MPKTELACGTCYDLHDFGGSRKGIEKGIQKLLQNTPFGALGFDFLDFGRFLERSDF